MTRRLRALLSTDRGFAMPVVIGVCSIVLSLAGMAAAQAIDTGDAADQDRRVKVARQAADAGFELAMFRLNKVVAGQLQPCADRNGAGKLNLQSYGSTGLWCNAVEDSLADGTTTQYQVSKPELIGTSPDKWRRKIVATGTYGGATRRVYTEIQGSPGAHPLFGPYGISAKDSVFLQNNAHVGSTTSDVDIRTNGWIQMKDSTYLCGDVSPGPGQTFTQVNPATRCPGKTTTTSTTPIIFGSIDPDNAAARTTNDNARICRATAPQDPCTNTSGVLWDPVNRSLTLQGQATLTLGGDVYSLCRLNMKDQSKLYIAARSTGHVKIYFDKPENCPNVANTEPIMLENGVGITNLNATPVSLQIYVAGSTSIATKVNIKNTVSGSQSTPMMIYAPNSYILLENHAAITGALVGKSVELKNDSKLTYDPNANVDTSGNQLVYQPSQYRECSSEPTGSTPDSGC